MIFGLLLLVHGLNGENGWTHNDHVAPRYEGPDIALNDFEDASLIYTNSQNDTEMFWTYKAGSTPSDNTGPSDDHSFQNNSGHYYYIETSGNVEGHNARLYSAWYDLNGFECVSFYVHMYGTQIGALNVYLEIGGNTTQLVSLTEELGDEWVRQVVGFDAPGVGRLVFEGVKGEDNLGDIAFDDVEFLRDCKFAYNWRLGEGSVNSSKTTGLLEVQRADNETWRGVCAESVDKQTADVLCLWAGYKTARMMDDSKGHDIQSQSPKFLDKLHCPYDAHNMSDCQRYGWSEKQCVSGTELTCDAVRCSKGQGEIEVRSCGECDFGEYGPGDDMCHQCKSGLSTVNRSSVKEDDCFDERLIRCELVEGVKQCRRVYCACDFNTETCKRGICYPRLHPLLSTETISDIASRVEAMPWYRQVSRLWYWVVYGRVKGVVKMVGMGVNWAVMMVLGFELW